MSRLATAYGGLPESPEWPATDGPILALFGPADMPPRGALNGRTAYGGSFAAIRAAGDGFATFDRFGVRPAATRLARLGRLAYVPTVFASDGLSAADDLQEQFGQDVVDAIALRDEDLLEADIEMVVQRGNESTRTLGTTNPYLAGVPLVFDEVTTRDEIAFSPGTGGFYAGTPFTASPEVHVRPPVGGGRFALILATVQAGPFRRLDDARLPQTSGGFNVPHDGCAGYFAFRYSFAAQTGGGTSGGTPPAFPGTTDVSEFLAPAQGFDVHEFLVCCSDFVAADALFLAPHAAKFDRYAIHWVSAATNRRGVFYTGTSTGTDRVQHEPVLVEDVYEPANPTAAGVDYSYEFADPTDPVAFADAIVDAAIAALT